MIAVYLAPRDEWSRSLEEAGCSYVEDVPGLENPAEAWEAPDGRVFLVPYSQIPSDDDEDSDERRVATYMLRKIVEDILEP